MSSHRDWFQAYSPLDPPRKIWLGDNTFIQALSVGRIPIHMRADHKWNWAILQDVLYVLDLQYMEIYSPCPHSLYVVHKSIFHPELVKFGTRTIY